MAASAPESSSQFDAEPSAQEIGALLFDQRCPEEGADICMEVDGKEIWAHSLVLTKRSAVLKALFKGSFSEAREHRARVEDCSVEQFEDFLHLLYMGSFRFGAPSGAKLLISNGKISANGEAHLSANRVVLRIAQPPADLHDLQELRSAIAAVDQHVKLAIADDSGLWLFARCRKANKAALDEALAQAVRDLGLFCQLPQDTDIENAYDTLRRLFAVMKLLDRYNVDGFMGACMKMLSTLVTWGCGLQTAVMAQMAFVRGSAFHLALGQFCKELVKRKDTAAVREFEYGFDVLQISQGSSGALECAGLQCLRWQLSWVVENGDLLRGRGAWAMRTIAEGIQLIVDGWVNRSPEDVFPSAKRARVDSQH